MRSRYTAFVRGHENHLFRTWHPATRPAEVRPDPGINWLGLEVVRTEAGGPEDATGLVEFVARYRTADGAEVLRETSRFERRAGRWVYRDGDVSG
jgi:SEC-C motif-containing protein